MQNSASCITLVICELKTSHKCQFSKTDIYALSKSWINNISIDVWCVMIGQYLKIWNLRVQKKRNIEKIIFKVVQMKFWAMHINNKKLNFDIFTVGNLLNIFMEHDLNILMIFGIKLKCIILTHAVYFWLLQIYPSFCAPGSHMCVEGAGVCIQRYKPMQTLSMTEAKQICVN